MKILITSDWYHPVVNGVVRSILNLKSYLEDRGFDVKVLTLSNSTESYKKENVYCLFAGKIDGLIVEKFGEHSHLRKFFLNFVEGFFIVSQYCMIMVSGSRVFEQT